MTTRDSFPAGAPCWVDLGSPDPDASVAFYSALFGWQVQPGSPETGDYRMAEVQGRPVTGIGPLQSEGQPPWWTTYVSVDDADATTKAVEAAGGQVLMPPMDVLTLGRMAVYADPGGAVISVWQPGELVGAGVVDEPGTMTWNELMVRDLERAKPFYRAVFGWQAEDVDMGGGNMYTLWKLPGYEPNQGSVAGAVAMVGDIWPADLPDHWMVYFAVADCDASAGKAAELGGKISVPPTSVPGVGRFAVLNGPHGEVFSILKNEPPAD